MTAHFSFLCPHSQTLSQEVGKGQKRDQKLCMQTYRHFFTACRIPGEFKDNLQILRKSSDHFIVAAFNQVSANESHHHCFNAQLLQMHFQSITLWLSSFQFYAVHLDASEKNLPTVDDLAICLHSIWTAAKGTKEKAPPVGILTTDNRKTWALARKQLLKLGKLSKDSSSERPIELSNLPLAFFPCHRCEKQELPRVYGRVSLCALPGWLCDATRAH